MRYINDKGEYYDGGSIVIGNRRYVSPSEEIILLAGYHPYTPPEPTEEQLLEMEKSKKINEIEQYDASDEVNQFYLVGQPMWLDASTRQTLRISIESYRDMGYENVTKWFNGQRFTFSVKAWLSMLNALEVYAAEALNVTESHIAEVAAMTDINSVKNYDYTTEYPEKLNLTTEWFTKSSV